MKNTNVRFISYVTLFVIVITSNISAALDLRIEPSLSPDSEAKTLSGEEQVGKEFMRAKQEFAHSFFRMALSSIQRVKDLSKRHGLEIPAGLVRLEQLSAEGRMHQIEFDILTAYHQGESGMVFEYANEASKLSREKGVMIPRSIFRVYAKSISDITETVYIYKKELRPDIQI